MKLVEIEMFHSDGKAETRSKIVFWTFLVLKVCSLLKQKKEKKRKKKRKKEKEVGYDCVYTVYTHT